MDHQIDEGQLLFHGYFDTMNSISLFLVIGSREFLVHHIIALGPHTTRLILVKGVLDDRGSKLMPDKRVSLQLSL